MTIKNMKINTAKDCILIHNLFIIMKTKLNIYNNN